MKNIKLTIDTGTFIRFWLVILGFIAAIGAIWLARNILIMVLISFFLALVLNRPVSFFARFLPGKSRIVATLIAYLIVIAIIAAVFFTVIPIFIEQIASFLGNLPGALYELERQSSWLGGFLSQYNLEEGWNNWLQEFQAELGLIASNIGRSFISIISALIGAIINVIIIAFMTFFILIEGPALEEKFWRLVYSNKKRREHHQSIAQKMYNVISNYAIGQMIVAAISATCTAIAIVILSQFFTDIAVSLALTAWLIAFITLEIPLIGAWLGGGLIAVLIALYSWPAALIYVAFLAVEQQTLNNLIQPKIQGKRLNISILTVLIAVITGLQIAGILGALVAIPITGCIIILVRDILNHRRSKNADASDEPINFDNEEPNNTVIFKEAKRKHRRLQR